MKVRKILNHISEKLSILILAAMVVLVTWQVGARYILKAPVPWSEALSKYLFIWLVLINGAYIFGRKEHMNIGYFKGNLSAKVQRILDYLIQIIILGFAFCILTWGGYMALKIGIPQKDAALTISMGYVYAALPISGILTALYSICNIIDMAKHRECAAFDPETVSTKEKGV